MVCCAVTASTKHVCPLGVVLVIIFKYTNLCCTSGGQLDFAAGKVVTDWFRLNVFDGLLKLK